MNVLSHPIGKFWAELSPTGAYENGLEEYAGKVVVPLKDVREKMLQRTHELKKKWREPILDMIELSLRIDPEYPAPLEEVAEVMYGYLMKNAPEKYLVSVLNTLEEKIPAYIKEVEQRELTVEERVFVSVMFGYVSGIANVWKSKVVKEKTQELIDSLLGMLSEFSSAHGSGLGKFECDDVLNYIKKHAEETRLVREEYYADLIKKGYGYEETPKEIVEKAKRWIECEIGTYQKAKEELEELGGEEAVKKEFALPTTAEELVKVANDIRKVLAEVAKTYFVEFPPKYDVRVMATPEFLRPFIPSGAAAGYNTLTDNPYIIYYMTPGGIEHRVDLVHLTFHEEYGHAVHMMWVAEDEGIPVPAKLLSLFSLPVSEGIAFHRERELLELLTRDTETLKKVISVVGGDRGLFLAELRHHTLKWRVMRYIRAYADPQFNMGWKRFEEIIDETTKWTKLPRKMIFDQLFNFLTQPGYAPSYSLAAALVRELQETAIKRGIERRVFNTWVARAGYIPLPALRKHLMKKMEYTSR